MSPGTTLPYDVFATRRVGPDPAAIRHLLGSCPYLDALAEVRA